jgi:hypothetical protein
VSLTLLLIVYDRLPDIADRKRPIKSISLMSDFTAWVLRGPAIRDWNLPSFSFWPLAPPFSESLQRELEGRPDRAYRGR